MENSSFAFKASYLHGGRQITGKDILILQVKDELRFIWQGEAGPLLGVHDEDISQVVSILSKQQPTELNPSRNWNLALVGFGGVYTPRISRVSTAHGSRCYSRDGCSIKVNSQKQTEEFLSRGLVPL